MLPVVTRFETYQFPVREASHAYMDPCLRIPYFEVGAPQRWKSLDDPGICGGPHAGRKLHLIQFSSDHQEIRCPTYVAVHAVRARRRSQEIVSRTLSVVVDNEPGVLARVIGLFAGRGYNIDSLTVTEVEHEKHLSRITVITSGTPAVLQQIKHQLERLVPVHRVRD